MGMYTQCRGWLNVSSIGNNDAARLQIDLIRAKEDFKATEIERSWVCDWTWLQGGSNGAYFLFFGAELKNYDDPFTAWIVHLLKYFPMAEGRLDIQYEQESVGDPTRVIKVYQGAIVSDERIEKAWCNGYGNEAKA